MTLHTLEINSLLKAFNNTLTTISGNFETIKSCTKIKEIQINSIQRVFYDLLPDTYLHELSIQGKSIEDVYCNQYKIKAFNGVGIQETANFLYQFQNDNDSMAAILLCAASRDLLRNGSEQAYWRELKPLVLELNSVCRKYLKKNKGLDFYWSANVTTTYPLTLHSNAYLTTFIAPKTIEELVRLLALEAYLNILSHTIIKFNPMNS